MFLWFSFLCLPAMAFAEAEGVLVLNLSNGWHALSPEHDGGPRAIVYVKNGETPYHYTEILRQEAFPTSTKNGVVSVEENHTRRLQTERCHVRWRPRPTDGQRSLFVYECKSKRRSGMVLTVAGDKKIYVVFDEIPNGRLNLAEQKRISQFLQENAKICLRSQPTKCVR